MSDYVENIIHYFARKRKGTTKEFWFFLKKLRLMSDKGCGII